MTLRTALAKSKNSVAWQLFEEVTPKVGLSYLKAMNFSKLAVEDERLTSSLGGLTNGASPVEMAAAYATLENDGDYLYCENYRCPGKCSGFHHPGG